MLDKDLFNDRISKLKQMILEIEYWAETQDNVSPYKQKEYFNYITYDLSDIITLSKELYDNVEEAMKNQPVEEGEK